MIRKKNPQTTLFPPNKKKPQTQTQKAPEQS